MHHLSIHEELKYTMDSTVRHVDAIPVTFYNVAEMAAESRRHKQFEEDAMRYGKANKRSNDEMAAALGLLMMRYPSKAHSPAQMTAPPPPPAPALPSTLPPTLAILPPLTPLPKAMPVPVSMSMSMSLAVPTFHFTPNEKALMRTQQQQQKTPIGAHVERRLIRDPPLNMRRDSTNTMRHHSLVTKLKAHSTRKSSLLMSCRNILKEFLTQNGTL